MTMKKTKQIKKEIATGKRQVKVFSHKYRNMAFIANVGYNKGSFMQRYSLKKQSKKKD
jgi:hypothetical protein